MRCRMPRMTFTSVANVPKNSPFLEKYCKVSWCLYPHAPEEVEKLYVMILNKHTIDARYFEILNHKTCQCFARNRNTAGYKELRKANIRELINKPNNGKLTSFRKHINRMEGLYSLYI